MNNLRAEPVTIFVISHGDNAFYLKRFLTKLFCHTDPSELKLRIGLNGACQESIQLARSARREFENVTIHAEPENIFKSPLMKKLFAVAPIDTEWMIWFDDDSHPYRDDWFPLLKMKIENHAGIDIWGNRLFTEADDAAAKFIRTAPWYQGKPLSHVKLSGENSEQPLLNFVEGGFWAARTRALKSLNWPDPRLIQHEEDYIFGEALRQNGFKMGQHKSGVRINNAERRCPPGTPSSYDSLLRKN